MRGDVEPLSKNDRETVAVVGRLYVVLVNEVAEAILGVWPMACLPFESSCVLLWRTGDAPFIESMEVEGDSTPLREARLLP